jgi:hypothetical protein
MSHLNVQFRKDSMSKFTRKRHFDELEFLSFVGGLLGLFAGFSSLSAIELLYWFAVRICMKSLNRRTAVVHPMGEIKVETTNIFENFLNSSSIHGLSYLKGINIGDRCVDIGDS